MMDTKCYIYKDGVEHHHLMDKYLLHEDPDRFVVLTQHGALLNCDKRIGWSYRLESSLTERTLCPSCDTYVLAQQTERQSVCPKCQTAVLRRPPKRDYLRRTTNGG
jgi:predicted RNA-binding Zn-ribbon protein involved in translation (DUF1610 family)